ncbi:hypothetical protein GCM10027168_68550 [Streptomyces capparidis]
MAETPSSHQQNAGDIPSEAPHLRHSSALAHRATATGRASHCRSLGVAFHTPRDAGAGGRRSRPGTLPPVPGRRPFPPPPLAPPGRAALVCLVVALLGLAAVAWQVVVDGPLPALDERVREAVAGVRDSGAGRRAEPVAQALADLGGTAAAGPVLAAAAVWAAWWRRGAGVRRRWAPLVWAAVAGAAVPGLVVPLKALIGRPGPDGAPLEGGQLGWFPSGHTVTAAVCYGAAALLVPAGRTLCARAALVVSAAVGPALVWCDYHWALDVVGGWCLAVVVLVPLRAAVDGERASALARADRGLVHGQLQHGGVDEGAGAVRGDQPADPVAGPRRVGHDDPGAPADAAHPGAEPPVGGARRDEEPDAGVAEVGEHRAGPGYAVGEDVEGGVAEAGGQDQHVPQPPCGQ